MGGVTPYNGLYCRRRLQPKIFFSHWRYIKWQELLQVEVKKSGVSFSVNNGAQPGFRFASTL